MIANRASILEGRTTTGRFDPSLRLDDATLAELVRLATQAPSAFNLQNWRFIAVRSDEAKRRLTSLAYGQRQVGDAAATYIVCGELDGYRALAARLQPSVDAGILRPEVRQAWVEMAAASHADHPRQQRDEAIRSASLAAMALLVAAADLGLDAGVLGGFDPDGIRRAFSLRAAEIPVMLVTVGRASGSNWPQKIRRPVSEVLEIR
jgi:nitroreductase